MDKDIHRDIADYIGFSQKKPSEMAAILNGQFFKARLYLTIILFVTITLFMLMMKGVKPQDFIVGYGVFCLIGFVFLFVVGKLACIGKWTKWEEKILGELVSGYIKTKKKGVVLRASTIQAMFFPDKPRAEIIERVDNLMDAANFKHKSKPSKRKQYKDYITGKAVK